MSEKIAIVGAGISGLSCANLLKEKGYQAKVFDKNDKPGGLIACTEEDGNLFHRVGGHVFNTKVDKVSEWFWGFFNKADDFIFSKRDAKIYMNKEYYGYPLENSLYKLSPEIVGNIIADLLKVNDSSKVKVDDFGSFLEHNFGRTLFELYFKPYNEKIWNLDLNQIPLPWLDGKLPMPNIYEIFKQNILRAEENNMVHSTFNYPIKGGSSFIADKLAKNISIEFNCKIKSVEYKNNQWVFENETFDHLIYTGDVRSLKDTIKLDDPTVISRLCSVGNLKSNGTSNVLCYVDKTDTSWLYLPEHKVLPHRIIYTGNFSASNNAADKLTCTVEFSGNIEEDVMRSELKKLPGNLVPIAFNWEPNSYVIQEFDTRDLIAQLKENLNSYNLHLIGRFAEWEYYNMDKVIEAAMNLVEIKFN